MSGDDRAASVVPVLDGTQSRRPARFVHSALRNAAGAARRALAVVLIGRGVVTRRRRFTESLLARLDELRLRRAAVRAGMFVAAAQGGAAPPEKFFRETPEYPHYDARYFRGVLRAGRVADILRELLAAFSELSRTNSLEFFLVHGTLLGWSWGRRMLPWDEDLDLSVTIDVLYRLRNLQDEVRHPRFLLEVNPNFVDRRTRSRRADDDAEPNRIDARFIDRGSGVFINISGAAPVAEGVLASKCPHLYREGDLFPLRRDTFEGVQVWVPNQADRLLHREYGRACTTRTEFNGHTWIPELNRWVGNGTLPSRLHGAPVAEPGQAGRGYVEVARYRRTVAWYPDRKRLVPVVDERDAPIPFGDGPGQLCDDVLFFELEDGASGRVFWGKKYGPSASRQLPLERRLYGILGERGHSVACPVDFDERYGLIFPYDRELFRGPAVHLCHAKRLFRRSELREIMALANAVVELPPLGTRTVSELADFQTIRTSQGLRFIDFTLWPEHWDRVDHPVPSQPHATERAGALEQASPEPG